MNRAWSDNELISHRWRIEGRPDVDPTLSTDKPPEGVELQFVNDYDITPAPGVMSERKRNQPFAWCCLCQEPTHWIGWVAEYEGDGGTVRALVGQQCAYRKGGEVTRRAASSYKARQQRSEALRARRAVLDIAPAVSRALADWGSSPGVAAVLSWRAQLRAISSELAEAVHDAARHEPPTFLIEHQVEGRRGPEVEYRAFAKVAGASLYAGPDPAVRIGRLREKFDEAILVLRVDGLPTSRMTALLLDVRRVAEGAREFERAYKGCEAALDDRSIDTLIRWLCQLPKKWERPHGIRREGRAVIVDRASWQKPTTHAIPAPSSIVRPDILDGLEEALLGKT